MKTKEEILEEVLKEMRSRYVTSNKPKVITIMLETIDLTIQKTAEAVFDEIDSREMWNKIGWGQAPDKILKQIVEELKKYLKMIKWTTRVD